MYRTGNSTMIDTNKLLNQFMGASSGATPGMHPGAGRGDLMKGAAVGGILGLLVGSRASRPPRRR
jgi:uncharacterized membrane protein YebE (DUF533 family)